MHTLKNNSHHFLFKFLKNFIKKNNIIQNPLPSIIGNNGPKYILTGYFVVFSYPFPNIAEKLNEVVGRKLGFKLNDFNKNCITPMSYNIYMIFSQISAILKELNHPFYILSLLSNIFVFVCVTKTKIGHTDGNSDQKWLF